jgi:hypothetical protein
VGTSRGHLLAIALLLAAAVALQVWRDRGWQAYEPPTPVMWLTAGPLTARAALGYEAIAADVYWMRSVVYFGRQRLSEHADKNYDLLYPLLNLVTSLDPRFIVAYRFGAIFLSESPPGGPGRPDLAIQLLQRGLDHSPERWEYARDIGFVYYWHYRDFEKAAQWFQRASEVPGAPVWLTTTAATVLATGGDRASARLLWRQLFDTADVEYLKREAAIRLAQLQALDEIDQLNELLWRYEARTQRFPQTWEELVAARVLRGVPLDPAGEPYTIEPLNEEVIISPQSALWPLPRGLEGMK